MGNGLADLIISPEQSLEYQDYAKQYQDYSTPEQAGLSALWETTIADASIFDNMFRPFGIEEPITDRTFSPAFNFSGGYYDLERFEGQGLSPSEELSMLDTNSITDFNTFKRMVEIGLISLDPKSGEVFNPYQQNIEGKFNFAEGEIRKAFESGQFGPSVLYDKSMGETVSDFRLFEQFKQKLGLDIKKESLGEVGKAFVGSDAGAQIKLVKGEGNEYFDQIGGNFYVAVDENLDVENSNYVLNLIKEADPEKYKYIMRLKENIKNPNNPRPDDARETLEKTLSKNTVVTADGLKLIRINDYSATPGATAAYKDAAAHESTSYLIGQAGQIAIEFVPVVGAFASATTQGIKAGGRLATFLTNKLGSKAVDNIKFICKSPCKISPQGKKILDDAVKNNLLSQAAVDQLTSAGITQARASNILAKQSNIGKASPFSEKEINVFKKDLEKKYPGYDTEGLLPYQLKNPSKHDPNFAKKIYYNKWQVEHADQADEAWAVVNKKVEDARKTGNKAAINEFSKVMDRFLNLKPIDEATGKPVTMEQWLTPMKSDGTLHTNPEKQRNAMEIGRAKWNELRNAKRSDFTMEGIDRLGKSEADRLFNSMKRAGEDKFKKIKDKQGNIIGMEVIDKSEPGFGNTYYTTGYLRKNPEKAKTSLSIRDHPTWQVHQDMIQAAKDIKFGAIDPKIADEIFNVVGDFSTYGTKGKKFTLNTLGDYLYTLDRYADPTKADLTRYRSLGAKNIVEIHHTQGVKLSATDPAFMQAASKRDNAAANKIMAAFNRNLETVGPKEAIKIAKQQAEQFPNIQMVFNIDGKIHKIGKNLKVDNVVNNIKNEINELWSKHLQGKPDEIKKMADTFGFNSPKGNAEGGTPISREKFKIGDRDPDKEDDPYEDYGNTPGTISWAVDTHTKQVQQDIMDMYASERMKPFHDWLDAVEIQQDEINKALEDKLNPPKPVKFKWSETPRLLTENPLIKQAGAMVSVPEVPALEAIELLYNGIRSGVENDIEMENFFPEVYTMYNAIKGPGVRETPKEQDYISMIDEINRAQETGLTNFAYSVADLALSIPDAILPTEFTEEVKRRYAEADLNKPETFLGQLGALAIEFGIPGGVAFKIINRFRKLTLAKTGGKVNLFTQKTYALEGLPKLGVQMSNVAKRAGTGLISFGAGDFVAGGPYNTISEMFDDPLISSKLVGEYEDTSNLEGKERVIANLKNRLRFGAEGAMIGGLFPLVGPALGVVGKNVLLKPALFAGKYGVLYPANYLAIKPATWLASKDPVVLPGIARGAGAFASFLGKDVLARLAATAATGGKAFVPSLKGNYGQLPELSKWRMFDVTSDDPLKRGLKKVDNFLKWFRDSGNQALYSFNLSGGAERFIKAKAREIEKYLTAIETKAYDLANGFLQRYNKAITSPAGQQHMLDQIHEYLRGNLKLSKIEPELQELAKVLKEEFNAIKTAYFKELPEGSGLRAALENNLDKYMRMSFSTFSNPSYKPDAKVLEDATNYMVGIINKNADFIEAAVRGSNLPADEAIKEFAKRNVDNMIAIGKAEGIDPLNALNKIQKEILRGDDFIQTGEELPNVIRKLLGQEKNLKHSVMMTAGSLVTQTANIKSFKEFAKHGLDNGYLFSSRAEALRAGIADPTQIGNLPGLGQMQDLAFADKGGPIGLFASREMKASIEGTGGMLDNLLQNSFYQSLIAYKAAVQTGKTVFSPATQTRNFGSAGFFPMHVGHIGGNASVTDAFKIIMDDIFGAGRTVNEVDLIKRISRKVELGVLDENIVASELGAILKDIKAGKLNSLGKLAERAESSKFYKAATRVYAGGDNVWKWYGHEYYMSQLKGAFKNVDEVKKFFDLHGIEWNPKNIMTGSMKTLEDGIEEAAAHLLRETYPSYSKVPEFIKAIRKLPIGNFVSFTSEILRTGFATSAIAMRNIASDNQALREMGYRMLSGQAITLGGMTAGVQGLGYALTNVTPEQIEVYKQHFAPDYMKYSSLIPVTNVKDGNFKVFDFSRYNPYDIIVASARELMKVADRKNYSKDLAALKEQLKETEDPSSPEGKALRDKIQQLQIMVDMNRKLDSEKIETDVLKQYLNVVGPLYEAVTGTFFGIPIGAEAFMEAINGKTREGSTIWKGGPGGMTDTEIFDRSMNHFFKTIEPGLISSGRKLFYSLRGDVSGVGQPLEIDTEVFKLMGGSNVTVDVLGSLDFKISDFQSSFRDPKMGKKWYSPANFRQRGPEQLVREYREQNEQAFRGQYDFYKAAMAAIDSGLLTRTEVMQALTKRIAPNSKQIPQQVVNLMNGYYTPITYGPEGLKSRMNKIIRNNPDLDRREFNYQYFQPLGLLEAEKFRWMYKKFSDFEKEVNEPEQTSAAPVQAPVQTATETEPQVAPIPDTGAPRINPTQTAAGNVDQATGLTQTETALLSPTEKAIRLKQRGLA